MKAPWPALGCLVLASLVFSCASPSSSGRSHHAKSNEDPDLDGDASAENGSAVGDDEAPFSPTEDEGALDSGMGTQAPPAAEAQVPRAAKKARGGAQSQDIEDFSSGPRTRYEVMSIGFDRATVMPSVNDFDPLDDPSPRMNCLSTKAADPNNVSEVVLKQMMVQIAGSADYGPLFPGSLDHVETRLVIGKNNGWVNSQNLTNEMRQVFELAKAPGGLVIRIVENKFGIYQDIGAPAEIWIRKDTRGHLFFKVYRLDATRNRTEVFIGYCFQRSGSPPIVR